MKASEALEDVRPGHICIELPPRRMLVVSIDALLQRRTKEAIIPDLYDLRADTRLSCMCVGTCRPKFYIRMASSKLHLCRYPNSAYLHAPSCQFHGPAVDGTSLALVDPPTVSERENRLSELLRRKRKITRVASQVYKAPPEDRKLRSPGTGQAPRRHRSTLGGQLESLIDVAGINVHDPYNESRDWEEIAARVRPFVETASPEGIAPFNLVVSKNAAPSVEAIREATQQPSDLAQLIGSLESISRTEGGAYVLQLEGMESPIQIDSARWKSAIRHARSKSISAAIDGLRSETPVMRVVCIMVVSSDSRGSNRGQPRRVCHHDDGRNSLRIELRTPNGGTSNRKQAALPKAAVPTSR